MLIFVGVDSHNFDFHYFNPKFWIQYRHLDLSETTPFLFSCTCVLYLNLLHKEISSHTLYVI